MTPDTDPDEFVHPRVSTPGDFWIAVVEVGAAAFMATVIDHCQPSVERRLTTAPPSTSVLRGGGVRAQGTRFLEVFGD